MKTSTVFVALIFSIAGVWSGVSCAQPSPFYGKYTKKRGNCSKEYRVTVSPRTFNQYEDVCKVTKNETKPDSYTKRLVTYLDLKCSSEGETNYNEVWLMDGQRADTVEAFYPKESPAQTVVLYRCR